MSLAPSYDLDVEIFKKKKKTHKFCVSMCVQVTKLVAGVFGRQLAVCGMPSSCPGGGNAGGLHFQTKRKRHLPSLENLKKP